MSFRLGTAVYGVYALRFKVVSSSMGVYGDIKDQGFTVRIQGAMVLKPRGRFFEGPGSC